MSKGRNTSVVGVRLPDDVVNRLKVLARKRRQTMSELLKPVIEKFAVRGYVPGKTDVVDYSYFDEIEESSPEGPASSVSTPVEHEASNIVPCQSSEAPHAVAYPLKEKYPVIKGHHPCPCGSGKRYRDCCRLKLA